MLRDNFVKIFWNGVFIANLTAIFIFWLANSGPLLASGTSGDLVIALGRIAGLLLAYFILVQLFLISRLGLIESRYGFDKLNWLHRTLGFSLLALVVLHPTLLSLGYSLRGETNYLDQLWIFISSWEKVLPAAVAAGILLFTGIISIRKIRSLASYGLWYFSHLFLYLAVGFALGHQTLTGDMASGFAFFYWYVLNFFVFGILIEYRFLKPAYQFFQHRFRVEKIVVETESCSSVYITGRNMEKFRFQAGQYAHFLFFKKNALPHHPFSFSEPYNGKTIRITVKNLGDFTSSVSEIKPGTHVWIEGPFGRFTLDSAITDKYCFIAGGIGITPISSLLHSLKNPVESFAFISNRSQKDAPLLEKLDNTGIRLFKYFTDEGEKKKIDLHEILHHCEDIKQRDVFICGPRAMTKSLTQELECIGIPKQQIHYELFNY